LGRSMTQTISRLGWASAPASNGGTMPGKSGRGHGRSRNRPRRRTRTRTRFGSGARLCPATS
jgi:hypothetical protein